MSDSIVSTQEPDSIAPSYKLFQFSGIIIAVIFGSFIAGGMLLAINSSRLGRRKLALLQILGAIALSIVSTLSIGFLYLFIESPIISDLIWFLFLLGFYLYSRDGQNKLIIKHRAAGGHFHSNWTAFGLSIIVVLLMILFLVTLIWILLRHG